jgi:vacuolar-type H+-ATPase subunit F/Vma7
MGRLVVLGEQARTAAFALAGARVAPAEDAPSAARAWNDLDPDVDVVVLTPAAAEAIGEKALFDTPILTVVMPVHPGLPRP